LPSEPAAVAGLCFSPDGSRLVVTRGNGAILWDLRRIRAALTKLGLDWDAPKYPEELQENADPIEIQLIGVELVDPQKMAEYLRTKAVAALFLNPLDADAHSQLGKPLYDSRKWPEAQAPLTAALAFKPVLAAAMFPRADSLGYLQRWQEAHAEFTR